MKSASVLVMFILLTLNPLSHARNAVSIQLVRSGDSAIVDTAYHGCVYQIQVLFENDIYIAGFSLGFRIYSEDGITWSWISQPNGYDEQGTRSVTVVPDSRIYPPDSVLNMTGFLVGEVNVDGANVDTMSFYGLCLSTYIHSGPPESMMALHFMPQLQTGEVGTICIDSTFVPPYTSWEFMDPFGPPLRPLFAGPFCWPVARMQYILGDFDMDGQISVGDVVEMVSVIFRGKIPIGPLEAGDVNCDGYFNVGDAIYLINYIFKFGPAPGCP